MLFLLEKWETADKGLRILRDLVVDRDLVWKICGRHRMGRVTYYCWLEAYPEAGFEGLVKKSTRPKQVYGTPKGIGDVRATAGHSQNVGKLRP